MKGPAARNRQVVLRCWVCPICGDVRLTQGTETLSSCLSCSDASRTVWMNLHEGPPPETASPVPIRPADRQATEAAHGPADEADG